MLKFIGDVLEIMVCLTIIAGCVLIVMWFIKMNNMSSLDTVAYKIDAAVNGEAVAMFRSFKDYSMNVIETIANSF